MEFTLIEKCKKCGEKEPKNIFNVLCAHCLEEALDPKSNEEPLRESIK
ncbi:hypothetical protein ShirakiTB12_54000 [Priestia megaterium]|uniref:Uncharacterized protein n=1 Tax=Priestia megaterium TaxID=1404 RepID=A0AAX6BT23_PRIMG|nr:hypothetical protein ShirakiTB12_54000 [Priestia megaterium]